jgi:hypothetical protein
VRYPARADLARRRRCTNDEFSMRQPYTVTRAQSRSTDKARAHARRRPASSSPCLERGCQQAFLDEAVFAPHVRDVDHGSHVLLCPSVLELPEARREWQLVGRCWLLVVARRCRAERRAPRCPRAMRRS